MVVYSREQRCGNWKRVPSGNIKLHLSVPTRNRGLSGEGVAMPVVTSGGARAEVANMFT